MRTIILDLETIPDPDLPFSPPESRPDAFPPPPHHQIVAFGVLCWGREGPVRLTCLGTDERTALEAFARLFTQGTQLVTWNGRCFDLPVILARCLKHRVPLPEYIHGRGYRYRFSEDGHLDLKDQISDFDSFRTAGLDTWSRLVGLPGKGDMDGSRVAEVWAAGEHERVRRYCMADVARTARLWLEWKHLTGCIDAEVLESQVAELDAFARLPEED